MAKTENKSQETKEQIEELNKELQNLSDEKLDEVAGGYSVRGCPDKCSFNVLIGRCVCPND